MIADLNHGPIIRLSPSQGQVAERRFYKHATVNH